jgi:hypothetical protein
MAIGLGNAPEKVETWTKEYRRRNFTFSKTRKRQDLFEYNCCVAFDDPTITGDTSTGVVLSVDLTPAQVESMKQLVDFMEGLK